MQFFTTSGGHLVEDEEVRPDEDIQIKVSPNGRIARCIDRDGRQLFIIDDTGSPWNW